MLMSQEGLADILPPNQQGDIAARNVGAQQKFDWLVGRAVPACDRGIAREGIGLVLPRPLFAIARRLGSVRAITTRRVFFPPIGIEVVSAVRLAIVVPKRRLLGQEQQSRDRILVEKVADIAVLG